MSSSTKRPRVESLLADFEPDFEFVPPPLLPDEEFAERLRRIRREAVVAGHDALVIHTDMVGWFHTSNAYLRYVCDWMREGVLIIPTDADKDADAALVLHPVGHPAAGRRAGAGRQIWQIGAIGREYA